MDLAWQKQVNTGVGGGPDRYFKWIWRHALPEKFQNQLFSLLIRFIMTIDGKYKTT